MKIGTALVTAGLPSGKVVVIVVCSDVQATVVVMSGSITASEIVCRVVANGLGLAPAPAKDIE